VVDAEEKRLEVIVEDTQLSLAIGKKGQNVRLASKLIGWNIDIKSEEEKRREIEEKMNALTAPTTPLSALLGVGPKTIDKLEAHGITSVERLADMTPEQLLEIPGIGDKMVEKIRQSVAGHFEAIEAGLSAPPADAAAVDGADAVAALDAIEELSEVVAETEQAEGEAGVETAGAEDLEASTTETPSDETTPEEVSAESEAGEATADAPEAAGTPGESSTDADAESETASEQPASDSPDQEKENNS
jgi:N utilization substance protein A